MDGCLTDSRRYCLALDGVGGGTTSTWAAVKLEPATISGFLVGAVVVTTGCLGGFVGDTTCCLAGGVGDCSTGIGLSAVILDSCVLVSRDVVADSLLVDCSCFFLNPI